MVRLRLVGNPAAVGACEKNHQQDDEYDRIDRRNEAYIVHDNFLLFPSHLILQQKGRFIYLRVKFRIAATAHRCGLELFVFLLCRNAKINLPTFAILLCCL
ncbi:hypothetical protein RP75_04400 [Agrobacterium arsenijevicii]|uniref:Uncharacterized protein n=1 Tax=Agrobacterium arsenijevicii TaxID=1585697 RepID=A0ABR5DBD6_9HYPH|nr:hypothetical protein RP75_04400 [Agrobacterium arsenijevicii]